MYDRVVDESVSQEQFLHILEKLRMDQCCLCGSVFPQGKSYKSFAQQSAMGAYCKAHKLDPRKVSQCFPQ